MGLISRHSIEAVLEANDIVDVVSSYVRLDKKSSLNLFGLCPFHEEKTPSFSVSPGKQIFYCFGCHKGGNVIKFIQEIEHLSYPEAIRFLADRRGLTLEEEEDGFWKERFEAQRDAYEALREAAGFFYTQLEGPQGQVARDYLKKRGIDRRLYRKYGLGYAPAQGPGLYAWLRGKSIRDQVMETSGLVRPDRRGGEGYYDFFRHRLIFPIIDSAGRVLAFGGRALEDKGPKYINSPETPVYQKGKHLFGIPQAIKASSKFWFLVEGYMDVLALSRAGIDHVVAPLGTALTQAQALLIGRHVDRVVILMDSDRAGREASLRSGEILEKAGIRAQYLFLQEAKDPDDYLNHLGRERLLAALDQTLDRTGYLLALLRHDRDQAIGMPANEYRDRAIDLLAAEPDGTRREIYGGQLAKELQISRRVVTEEIERRRSLTDPPSASSRRADRDSREEGRPKKASQGRPKVSSLEWMLLTLLANQNHLAGRGPEISSERLSGYALKEEIKAYLASEAVGAPLSASDFNQGPVRRMAGQALEDARQGRLTLASLHSIVDSILEAQAWDQEGDPDPVQTLDPDRIHAMIQKHLQNIEGNRLPAEAQEKVFLQKLAELRLANWRRQAARLNHKGHALEMGGQDQEAGQYYKQAAMLLTAADAFRMIIQGEK